jgi:anti-anti-sigma factor
VQFEVERTTVAGRPALGVRGELDIATAPELAAAVDAHLAARPSALVVDLTHTTFLDSSGARRLVHIARQAAAADVPLHVLVPHQSGGVRLVIDLLELGQVLPIVGSVFEIDSGVAGPDGRP